MMRVASSGELDLAGVDHAEQMLACAAEEDGRVVVDLSGLELIDLSGLRLLLAAHQRLGHRLILTRGPYAVQRVFELTDTIDELPIGD